jgi:hypothetical protein
MIPGEPPFPDRQQPRREIAAVTPQHLDAYRFRLEMPIDDQPLGERYCVVQRPVVPVSRVDRSGKHPDRTGADVVEAKIVRAAEIAAGVERSGRPRETLQFTPRLDGSLCNPARGRRAGSSP